MVRAKKKGTRPNRAASRLQKLTRQKVRGMTLVVTDRNNFDHAAAFYGGSPTSLSEYDIALISRAEFAWTIYAYAYLSTPEGKNTLHHIEINTRGAFVKNSEMMRHCWSHYDKLTRSHKMNRRHAGYIASMVGPQKDEHLMRYMNIVDQYFKDTGQ